MAKEQTVKVGHYEVHTEVKVRDNKKYFLAVHESNPSNVELCFIKKDEKGKLYLKGPTWFIVYIEKNLNWR